MSALLLAIGAALVLGAGGVYWRMRAATKLPDHGTVSTSWLAEQKLASRDRTNP